MTKILVVDDELKIARLVKDYLVEAGFDVVTARDGHGAVALARSEKPDLIVLDLGLPNMDGLDVTRTIRSFSTTPIVMLTARSEETDRVIGLELGADDYIVKPFSTRELVARIKAVLRRTTGQVASEIIRVRDVEIDLAQRKVKRNGEMIDLTTSEFDLLNILTSPPGRVFTRAQLLDSLRGDSFESYERAIDSHIKNLRKKLETDQSPRYIQTVYGVGYRFNDET
ncbi:MAG: response regulator transcription factor [Actinomycetota bacterium]|nr:response regulator transcription factor [Actinomycetota bacterium]